jgi:hypothetical protein
MTEFLNSNSGWLSLVALILVFPLTVFANLATPKFQAWIALRSNNAIQQRILFLERLVSETDRLVSEPTYAVAMFVDTAVWALVTWIIFLFIGEATLALLVTASRFTPPVQTEFTIQIAPALLGILLGMATGSIVLYFISSPTFELFRMTRRVTGYKKWREQTSNDIEELKRQLSQ